MDNQYDFYKPNMSSEYPIVDGSLSINCYLTALEECYKLLQKKNKGEFTTSNFDYLCFHCPFYKMVQKAFARLAQLDKVASEQQVKELFMKKVHPTLYLSKTLGNIYTGSLYTGLLSLMLQPNMKGKKVLMFSYGSGLMSSMFSITVRDDLQDLRKTIDFESRLSRRVAIPPQQFENMLQHKQERYGKVLGQVKLIPQLLEDGSYYLVEVDDKMRRKYQQHRPPETPLVTRKDIATTALDRIEKLDHQIKPEGNDEHWSGLYKLSVDARMEKLLQRIPNLDVQLLQSGGLSLSKADAMIENVVGRMTLPLAIAPNFNINQKAYVIPMSIEEPSVVAACSSIAKMVGSHGFTTSSTPSVMIGQVHLPECEPAEAHLLLNNKKKIMAVLNDSIGQLVKRGGGVEDLRIRRLNERDSVAQIYVAVCEAMGANIVNTLCEKLKNEITQHGIKCGIAVLSNYCTERLAMSTFELPLKEMEWKGHDGIEVAMKILEAFEFAKTDKHRATTHNKGILNGIDAVCLATGQDWRAIESASHAYACRTGQYQPLTRYEIVDRKGQQFFKGTLELPISVGIVGGALEKNGIYKQSLQILGNPESKELSEVLVTVGLAQNFAALRALAIEGIQKGHMALHARSTAVKAGVPSHLIQEACRFMSRQGKLDEATAKRFLQTIKPKL